MNTQQAVLTASMAIAVIASATWLAVAGVISGESVAALLGAALAGPAAWFGGQVKAKNGT
jgi:hypothetical protein